MGVKVQGQVSVYKQVSLASFEHLTNHSCPFFPSAWDEWEPCRSPLQHLPQGSVGET